jgi:hypothetical protein
MFSRSSVMPRLRGGQARSDRIDRLGWVAGVCFDAYGLRFGVRFNEPRLLERLGPHLPPGWKPCSSPVVDQLFSLWVDRRKTLDRRPARVYAGPQERACSASLDEAFEVLESEMRLSLATSAPRHTFVHAGAVGWRNRAVLVPGRSRSGKTTLVAELVKAGASYYSDEFAVLDRRGRVHPFAKPLSIREEGRCDAHALKRHAEELGGACGRAPLDVGLVVFAAYRPRAVWQPTVLTAGRAILELLAHTVPARLRPEASLDALRRAVAHATVLEGDRGDARDLARDLLDRVQAGENHDPTRGERGRP